jgi:hypothetical protein
MYLRNTFKEIYNSPTGLAIPFRKWGKYPQIREYLEKYPITA